MGAGGSSAWFLTAGRLTRHLESGHTPAPQGRPLQMDTGSHFAPARPPGPRGTHPHPQSGTPRRRPAVQPGARGQGAWLPPRGRPGHRRLIRAGGSDEPSGSGRVSPAKAGSTPHTPGALCGQGRGPRPRRPSSPKMRPPHPAHLGLPSSRAAHPQPHLSASHPREPTFTRPSWSPRPPASSQPPQRASLVLGWLSIPASAPPLAPALRKGGAGGQRLEGTGSVDAALCV